MTPITPLRQRMTEDMQLRNLSPETQRNYIYHIFGLARFYRLSPDLLSLEDLRDYQLHLLNERHYSAESVCQFVSAAKFLYNVTLETPWPEGALLRPRRPERLPVVLSVEEVESFFNHLSVLRYRAPLMIAYGAGLRISEVIQLKISDIDSKRMLIRVEQGKGKKDRYAMLSPCLLEVLRAWYRAARPRDWLFPGRRPGYHMHAPSLQEACRQAAQLAGLAKRVTVHTLRHSCATHLLENGTELRVIQTVLGHSKIETTARYTYVSPQFIGQTKSPLDQLKLRRGGQKKART